VTGTDDGAIVHRWALRPMVIFGLVKDRPLVAVSGRSAADRPFPDVIL